MAGVSDDASLMVLYPVWRDVFLNDGTGPNAEVAFEKLSAQPLATFTDKNNLKGIPAAWKVAESYMNGLHDAAMPASKSWHPGQSEKLGVFRLIQRFWGHQTCFRDP